MRMVTIIIGKNCTDENRLVGPDALQSDFGQNETPETAMVSGALVAGEGFEPSTFGL